MWEGISTDHLEGDIGTEIQLQICSKNAPNPKHYVGSSTASLTALFSGETLKVEGKSRQADFN